MLKIAPFAFAAAPAASPALADDSDIGTGIDLLSEGTQLLLRGLMGEIEPTLKEFENSHLMLRGLMDEFEPALKELQKSLSELNAYHPPEILPNGDIIIRRKTPLDPTADNGEIEL